MKASSQKTKNRKRDHTVGASQKVYEKTVTITLEPEKTVTFTLEPKTMLVK